MTATLTNPPLINVYSRFDSIQVMRAVAALLVFLFHSLSLLETYSGSTVIRTLYQIWSHIGPAGVDIFFVISGFIIFNISTRDMDSRPSASRFSLSTGFLVRRAARIYPLYWITVGLAIFVPSWWSNGWHLPMLDRVTELKNNPEYLLLWGQPSFHLVAWTLVYEMLFYAAISVLMLVGRTQFRISFFCLCCFQVAFVTAALVGFVGTYTVSNPITLEFIIGVSLAYIISRRMHGYPLLAIFVGLIALIPSVMALEVGIVTKLPLLRVIGYGLPFALILYGIISLEVKSRKGMPRVLIFCGDISYSIYLWHIALLIILGFLWSNFNLFASPSGRVAFIAAGIAVTFSVAILSYNIIEKPLMKAALHFYGVGLNRLQLFRELVRGWSRPAQGSSASPVLAQLGKSDA
jgi:peptidoglycan/LPS O-acetylase OafA/YrhL